MPSPQELAGKLAIVTGAAKSNGIGFATATALAQAGADIVLHYNTNEAAAKERVAELKALGVEVVAVQADATASTFGDDLVKETLKAFSGRKIDIIINNATVGYFHGDIESSPVSEFDSHFHANVRAPHSLVLAALPHIPSGGRIINIGSLAGHIGTKFAVFYAASKAALSNLTVSWAEELGAKGITVNVVCPGPIQTDNAPPEEFPLTQKFRMNQAFKRNGTAEECAKTILFVAGPGASFISGQVINVDGGFSYI